MKKFMCRKCGVKTGYASLTHCSDGKGYCEWTQIEVEESNEIDLSDFCASELVCWIVFSILFGFSSIIWYSSSRWQGFPLFDVRFLVGEALFFGFFYLLKDFFGSLFKIGFCLFVIAASVLLLFLLICFAFQ